MAASAVSRRSVTRPQMSVAEIKNDIGAPDRRSLTGRQLKPVTKTNGEGEGAKHKLRESQSNKAGAKQDKTRNGHGQEAPGSEFITHGTPPFACPARMEVLCPCTVKEFSFWRAISRRVDALMQQFLIDSQAPRRRSLRLLPSTAPATRQAARLVNRGASFQARYCERPWTYATDGDQRRKWLRNGDYQIVNGQRRTMIHFRGCRSGALGELLTAPVSN